MLSVKDRQYAHVFFLPFTQLTSTSFCAPRSPVYATQLHALDALNTLANEYHVVLRCLARIGARHTLDAVSALIHARKAKLGSDSAAAPEAKHSGNGKRRPRYTREQLHELRVRCSTLKQRLRYRNRERKSE